MENMKKLRQYCPESPYALQQQITRGDFVE